MDDLSGYLADPCWMFVLLARKAPVGVIIRRGPAKWHRITLWDTVNDRFDEGQWFHGSFYPERCDISPNGKLLVYFAGKFNPRDMRLGYSETWTAVSRPPYLTALALWPIGDARGGRGVFLDDRTVLVDHSAHHPNHPPGPLNVVAARELDRSDPRSQVVASYLAGWQGVPAERQPNRRYVSYAAWRKTCGEVTLERAVEGTRCWPSREGALYTLYRKDGTPIAIFEAHWADFDQHGRLVATVGGRVVEGSVTKDGRLLWREVTSFHEEKPVQMEAPEWAQHW